MKKIILTTSAFLVLVTGVYACDKNDDLKKCNKLQKHNQPVCIYESEKYSVGAVLSEDGVKQQCVTNGQIDNTEWNEIS